MNKPTAPAAPTSIWDDFPRRLAIFVDHLAGDRRIDVAPCSGCPATMTMHANQALTDTFWTSARPATTAVERYDVLKALEVNDIAAYSRTKAHLETYGRLPGEHVCIPDTAHAASVVDRGSIYAEAADQVRMIADLEGSA